MRIILATVMALAATPALAFSLTSPDVADGKTFAAKFICAAQGGSNVAPAFRFTGVSAKAKSLAITIHDPDAPAPGGFWHWVLVDLPPTTTGLAQGAASPGGTLPAGATPLPNGAGHANYDGPCPPAGIVHHYVTTLYALPVVKAGITVGMKPGEAGAWLTSHAIATAVITPVFQKK
jgi:Raf kinase inhibitor-like YbhB/YbcL family protein